MNNHKYNANIVGSVNKNKQKENWQNNPAMTCTILAEDIMHKQRNELTD